MANSIIIQTVPFCFGPASISIAIARSIKKQSNKKIIALANTPSLDLLESEDELFACVHKSKPNGKCDVQHGLISDADFIISVCDFDFASQLKSVYPQKKTFFCRSPSLDVG